MADWHTVGIRCRERVFASDPRVDAGDFCRLTIDLLYGDQQGGQRTISRFTVLPATDDGWYAQVARHWNLDRPDPR